MAISNTFLLLRTVLFALLSMFAFLSVVILAWNISSLSSNGQLLSTPSIIMITSNCLLLICIGSSIIGYFVPQIPSTRIMAECGWMAVLSLFQLGMVEWSVSKAPILKTYTAAAIILTTSGLFLNCTPTGNWNVCASTLVLVPVSWLNSLIAFAYFIGLFVTVMVHQCIYPDIWTRTVYAVDWFVDPRIEVLLPQTISSLQLGDYGVAFYTERRRLSAVEDIEKAPWAENVNVRRGKDNPYAASKHQPYCNEHPARSARCNFAPRDYRRTKTVSASTDRTLLSLHSSGRGTPPAGNSPLPPRPSHSITSSTDSRYMEGLKSEKTLQPVLQQTWDTTSLFPSTVDDHDLPIPLPNRSEWIRADKF